MWVQRLPAQSWSWTQVQQKVEVQCKWECMFQQDLLTNSHFTNWNTVSWYLTLVNCLNDLLCTEMIAEVGKRKEGRGREGKRIRRKKDRKERMTEGKREGRSHKPAWCSRSSYFFQLGPSGTRVQLKRKYQMYEMYQLEREQWLYRSWNAQICTEYKNGEVFTMKQTIANSKYVFPVIL